jgi:hypothetical protein
MIAVAAFRKKDRPLGVILHRGRSPFANREYVVIAVLGESSNDKTGEMIQTYIIVDGVSPNEAVQSGEDEAICGGCVMRRFVMDDGRVVRGCYVNVGQGPREVYEAYMRGRYVDYNATEHDRYFRGRMIRWGTYGEPVLIPLPIVAWLCSIASGWTGYTHQFFVPEFAAYKRYFMASVHEKVGTRSAEHAHHLGWRTFRSSSVETSPVRGEVVCPASAEAGKRLTCSQCGICDGSRRDGDQRVSVVIATHGGLGVMYSIPHIPGIAG